MSTGAEDYAAIIKSHTAADLKPLNMQQFKSQLITL